MTIVGSTPVLPELKFGYFEGNALGIPSSEKEQDLYRSAIWYPLPQVVDRFITSDLDRGIVRSWKPGGPDKTEFAYVQITHWNMKNTPITGELVINKKLAGDVADIALDIFKARFPIESNRLIDYCDANDDWSMSYNISSALCVRPITGSGTLSNHALGRAWDINPLLNPYHNPAKGIIAPANGAEFLDRSLSIPGMIKEGDPVVTAFDLRGWEWGGRWGDTDRIDYQHFQKSD